MDTDAKAPQMWVTSLWGSPKVGTLLRAGLEPCLHPELRTAVGMGGWDCWCRGWELGNGGALPGAVKPKSFC